MEQSLCLRGVAPGGGLASSGCQRQRTETALSSFASPCLATRLARNLECRAQGSGNGSTTSNGSSTSAAAAADVSTGASLDVGSVVVAPVFRSAPRPKTADEEHRRQARVLFVSEGNVCRSVIAEAVFRGLLEKEGLTGAISCESKAVRDYNLGEGPDPLAVDVCSQCGISLDPSLRARLFKPADDIVDFDLLAVMDKFNAADVLKEVSVFDTVDPGARYSSKVRRLGDFCKSREIGDIDDPLYGNMGGSDELENLSDALTDIQEACMGLLDELKALQQTPPGKENLRGALASWLQQMDDMDWLVPPMLQKRG